MASLPASKNPAKPLTWKFEATGKVPLINYLGGPKWLTSRIQNVLKSERYVVETDCGHGRQSHIGQLRKAGEGLPTMEKNWTLRTWNNYAEGRSSACTFFACTCCTTTACYIGAITCHATNSQHQDDVTMSAMASQITSHTIVYSTVYWDGDKKHQSSASLACVWGIHRGPVNSPHKWPVTRKMFPFHDVIMKNQGPISI